MANGGANISRGMGRGAAQVYDTSAPINMYAKLMQQQQLKRAAEQKALTDELGKVTPEGLRQPDVKGFIDQYGRWRDKAIEADAERNPTRKAILKQEAEREKLTTLMYIDDSKNESRNERDRNKMLLDPNVRDRYDDVVIERVLKSSSLAKDDPNYVRDMNQFQIRPDLSKLTKDLDDLDKNILQSSEWSAPITEAAKQGNVEGVYVYNKRTIDPKKQATAYASLFDLDRKFQAGLREMFPDLAGLPKEQLKAQGIPLLVQQRVREESSKPDFQPNKDLTMQNLAIQRERRLAAKDSGINEVGEVEVNKEFFGEGTKTASGQRVKTPVKTIGFDYFIKPTQKNFASTQLNNVLNLSTGKNQMMNADTNAALIGLGYTKTKGGKLQVKAVIVNSDKDEFAVNEMDLPITVRNSDEYRAAKNKLNSEYKRLQQSKPTTKPAKELIGETVRIQLPTGEIGEVPKDKSAAFLKKYPKAKIIK
jgi:hypothetical protein